MKMAPPRRFTVVAAAALVALIALISLAPAVSAAPPPKVLLLTKDNFDDELKGRELVVVAFTESWW